MGNAASCCRRRRERKESDVFLHAFFSMPGVDLRLIDFDRRRAPARLAGWLTDWYQRNTFARGEVL